MISPDREAGKDLLSVKGLTKIIDGETVPYNIDFIVDKGDKIAFVGENELLKQHYSRF
jgi:ATPase subunit of ABC transporter with duplicated ATPase domains